MDLIIFLILFFVFSCWLGWNLPFKRGLIAFFVSFVFWAWGSFSWFEVQDLKLRAVEEKAATWEVCPDTGKKEFIWIGDLFSYEY